ncbi:MAG: S-methyl-5'-thioadenosine phosphorylase [Synechococcaceae bacterium WBB_32_011]|nr:S-methyl-5'-thioadenosine phosphorylase [Synechococcaceae bacterium WB7_1B_046]NDA75919.1 S-methyl-5'-thioadenosine phosphorylase [Synechococcaceae bacterium WB8_3_299]NDD20500.1 S-methyl-5'-thioadenosine phosphorylase [Synechococcaceae bacterium WBA_3_309]NDE21442.1 S-methyl-5'-thioadenosine phosphorylase [Synechococcaceae bacterium WB9_3_282]NDG01024.1 S-methyl-5'-thioadenosine phosphorylase [Synechococcaceae bacterium WBB_32_011]
MTSANPSPSSMPEAPIGVLGGSGLYAMEGLRDVEELQLNTPFGKPSDSLRRGRLGDAQVVFLARHGRHHSFLPTEVPYRANIWALRSLGVRWIISCSAVGSLQEAMRPLDLVVPDQFLDRTHQRPCSFFGEGAVAHVSLAEPFCAELSKLLCEAVEEVLPTGRDLHRGGTYLCMEGPAFSTKAESNFYRSLGCDVIGMTNHTEARLAREAEIAYTTLAMVTDYDCWHPNHDAVTVEMVIANLKANAATAQEVVAKAAAKLHQLRPSSKAHTALANALMTAKEHVPAATRERLDLFTTPYWGPFN